MPSGMTRWWRRSAGEVDGAPQSPKLLAGTGKDQPHLIVVATCDRGLAGAFNSNIVRAARRKARRAASPQGKTVDFYIVGRKGRPVHRSASTRRASSPNTITERHEGADLSPTPQVIAKDLIDRYAADEYRRRAPALRRTSSRRWSRSRPVDQIIPVRQRPPDDAGTSSASLPRSSMSRTRKRSSPTCCRATSPIQIFSRAAGEPGRFLRLADDRDGQCDPQRRRHDQPADHPVQPQPSGRDHDRTGRDHLGRRSALRSAKAGAQRRWTDPLPRTKEARHGNRRSRDQAPQPRQEGRRAEPVQRAQPTADGNLSAASRR